MATLGTASILITADDRQLQSVLNNIPNLFARTAAAAEGKSVSAFGNAGASSGAVFSSAVASKTASIGTSLTNPIASVTQAYSSAGTVGGGAFSTAAARATANIGAAVTAPIAATASVFTSAGNIGGLNFTRGVTAGISNVAASVTNPIAAVTQAYSVAGIASGKTFSTGIAAGSSGISASITNPVQSIAQVFSAAGTASGNGFGIGLRSSTAGIGASIAGQLGSATSPALSAGEQAGKAFSDGFRATARAGTGAVGGIFGAGQSLGNSARQSIRFGVGQQIGFGITQLAGGAIGAATNTKNIADFDAASRKAAQITKDQKGMEKAAQSLSKELRYGVTSTDVLVAAYETLSSGFEKTTDVTNILRSAIKATIASQGEAKLDKVNDAITSIINSYKAYGYSAKDAGAIINQISGTVDAGKIKYGEYAAEIGKASSVAAFAGVSFEDLNATIAKATISGQRPESVLTGIPGLINNISKPTKAAAATAASLGIEFSASALKAKGLLGIMESISKATVNISGAKRSEAIQTLFGSIRGKNIAAALISDPVGTQEMKASIGKGNVDKNFNLATGGLKFKQEALGNRIVELDVKVKTGAIGNALATGLGLAAMAIERVISVVEKLNQAYDNLSPGQKAFVNNVSGVALAVGAVATAIFTTGVVVGLIGAPIAAVGTLIGGFVVGLGSIAIAAAPVIVPITAVSVAVYEIAKAFGATNSTAFVAALSAAGIAVGLLFGPAIISSVVAGSIAVASSLGAIAIAGAAAAVPFLPFIAIGAAVVGSLYLLYEAFNNPAIKKWAEETKTATGKFFNEFSDAVTKWGDGFSKGIEQGFAATIDFFKNGWKAISDTSTDWASSSTIAIESWGKNLGDGTTKAFDATVGFFVSGWNSLAQTTTGFVSGASSTLSGWWSSMSAGFGGWFNSLGSAFASGWDGLLNLSKQFAASYRATIFDFSKSIVGYFNNMSAGVWNQLQRWFPWLTSIGEAVNNLGSRIIDFKDGVVIAFNLAVRAGQSLGEGLSKYFNDVIASIKGMLDWVGQIPANFGRAIDSINIFKDKSSEATSSVPTPTTTPQSSGQADYGEGAYGKKVPLRSSASTNNDNNNVAFDPNAKGAIVASSDLTGLGLNFSKSVNTAGDEFRSTVGQSVAQLRTGFNVASPIFAVTPTAKSAAYYNPPMAFQGPMAPRRRGSSVEPHYGIDIPGRLGTPVEAAFNGEATYEKVNYSGRTTGAITLRGLDTYGNKIALRYFHLGQETMAKAGQKMLVKAGSVIGAIGVDGKQGGNDYHVDLKATVNGVKLKDPRMLLRELTRQQEGTTTTFSRSAATPIASTIQPQSRSAATFKSQFQDPRGNGTIRVGASTYTPGGGGIEGPEKDVRGNRLTRNDKALAIPGLANGGIKNTVPYGTIVVVTNPKTGLSSQATVRDAGPFVGATNRQADLTIALAKAIKFSGTGQVDIKIVKLPAGFDPKGIYQLGDTKKFGSDKKSNVTPGPAIDGPGVVSSTIAPGGTVSRTQAVDARRIDDTKTRLDRAIADEERIRRIGVSTASGRKGTNRSSVQTRMNETYARQLEKALRRREDAQKAFDRAQSKGGIQSGSNDVEAKNNFAKSEVDALKNQFDLLQNQAALANAKTDKAVSDPRSGITLAIADAVKAKRTQTQFNALIPILKAAQSLRLKYAGNNEISAQINQLETAIYGIGKDTNESKTKVAAQTIDEAKVRVSTAISDAAKRDATIENEQKLGTINSSDATDRMRANKTRMAAELVAQIEGIRSLKSREVSKADLTALDELLATIDRSKADAIASLREQVQGRYTTAINSQIESGDKQIGDVALARSIGNISTKEEDKQVLDIRIATNNEIQKTVEGLLYMKQIAQNSDDVKIIDDLIRKTNEYYARTIVARKEFQVSSYSSQFDKIISVRDKRTTDVNQQAELNFAPTNRDVEQQEKALLVIRQQSTVELKKLRDELEQYSNSLSDADVKTREIVNEQVAKIRAIEVETAKATANADASAVLLRNTTKSIATVGQESFKSMFLDAQNGFRNVGSIVDNLINKIADIGLNAIFDSVIGGNKGGGGFLGTVLGFLGFDRGGTVPNLSSAGSGAKTIANYSEGGSVGLNKTIGKAFGIVGGLQAALKREGAGGVPIVAKEGEEVLDRPNAKIYRNLVASGEWERVRRVNNYATGGSIGSVSNLPTLTNSSRSSGSILDRNIAANLQKGSITVDRINGIDYVTIEQMAAFVDIKMPQAAQAGAALSERNLSNTNYRQRNGL